MRKTHLGWKKIKNTTSLQHILHSALNQSLNWTQTGLQDTFKHTDIVWIKRLTHALGLTSDLCSPVKVQYQMFSLHLYVITDAAAYASESDRRGHAHRSHRRRLSSSHVLNGPSVSGKHICVHRQTGTLSHRRQQTSIQRQHGRPRDPDWVSVREDRLGSLESF